MFARWGGQTRAEYQCWYCRERKLYEQRNCSKHFPELVQIGRKPNAWSPKVEGKKTGYVKGYHMAECPTSFITPDSTWILELASANGVATRDAGATLFGPDTRKWPAWWMDAVITLAGAKADWERAEFEASTS